MRSFAGKLAVVTGGGGGMGRELVRQLAAEGCSVATCDLSESTVNETVELAREAATGGARVTAHVCELTDEASVNQFRDEVVSAHQTDHINLLFNNAGVFGAGSFLQDDRDAWERVFSVCWYGVYYTCRAFVPLVVAADEGHVINTASINALRATHGPGAPSTSYSAGKWAVRGFTEALIEDFRTNAPHVKVSLVMPGGVGTPIRANSERILSGGRAQAKVMSGSDHLQAYLIGMGVPEQDVTDDVVGRLMDLQQSDVFALPPADAVRDLLDGVREERWRIFIGIGAVELDEAVRATPETIYDADGPSLIDRDLLVSMMVLESRFAYGKEGVSDGVVELRLDSSPIYCHLEDGRLRLSRRAASEPLATLATDRPTFRALVLHEQQLDDVLATGRGRLEGDATTLREMLGAVAT
jgi:NAD(P)-dependent dehydrogenase (short-subunit alcohol dehydrogenase family)